MSNQEPSLDAISRCWQRGRVMVDDDGLRCAAFTHQGHGGNPAGVVLEAAGLSGGERQDIARAMGYSETVFLERTRNPGHFRTRYYSPLAAVALPTEPSGRAHRSR